MEVVNDLFDYGLKIVQNTEYFKFSIDSILLGEFVKVKNNQKILDICTGNAPIPLILLSKNKNLSIDCVEIQKEISSLAQKSVNLNNFEHSIRVYNCDIKTYKPNSKYDIVVCNPPYFKVSSTSQKNSNEIKKIARHEIYITLKEIIKISKSMLNENGNIYLVQRIERFLETINELEKNKFGIRNVVFVNTKKNNPSEFFLIEASLSKKSDLKVKTIDIYKYKTYQSIFKEDKK